MSAGLTIRIKKNADGSSSQDFGTPWPRGPLPPVANISEMIVGFLDLERASGHLGSADSLNALLADYSRQHGLSAPMLGEDDLGRVRHARGELFARWDALPFGEVLDLEFAIEDHRASAANQRSHLGAARPL